MKYLIALDLDNTLLNSESKLSKKSIEVVNKLKEKGHKIVLATGRPYFGAITFYNQLKLDELLVTDNGALITNPSNESFKPIKKTIPLDIMHKVFHQVKPYLVSALYTSEDVTYAYKYSNELEYVFNGIVNPKIIEGNFDEFEVEPTSIIVCTNANQNELFEDAITSNFSNFVGLRFWGNNNNLGFYEIYLNSISKASALKEVLSIYNMTNEELIALGDGINDLEMIKFANLGVAMKNACSELLNVAKKITDDHHNDDGAAKFLEKLLLT